MATEEARRFFKERKEAIDAASTGETLRRAFDLKNMQGTKVYIDYLLFDGERVKLWKAIQILKSKGCVLNGRLGEECSLILTTNDLMQQFPLRLTEFIEKISLTAVLGQEGHELTSPVEIRTIDWVLEEVAGNADEASYRCGPNLILHSDTLTSTRLEEGRNCHRHQQEWKQRHDNKKKERRDNKNADKGNDADRSKPKKRKRSHSGYSTCECESSGESSD